MDTTVNGACPFEQTLNPVTTDRSRCALVETGQVVSKENLFNNIMILYMYIAKRQGKITLTE